MFLYQSFQALEPGHQPLPDTYQGCGCQLAETEEKQAGQRQYFRDLSEASEPFRTEVSGAAN